MFYSGGIGITNGKRSSVKNSYLYNTQDNEWVQKADMIQARRAHACGRVTSSTGKDEVVVAGGYFLASLSTTEIYTVESDTWRSGTPLPQTLSHAASLPFEDTFLILGGGDSPGECIDTIYKVWITMILLGILVNFVGIVSIVLVHE